MMLPQKLTTELNQCLKIDDEGNLRNAFWKVNEDELRND